MKKIFTLLMACVAVNTMHAQSMISNGFGSMALINGTTYQKLGNLGTLNYAFVTGSTNGFFYSCGVFPNNSNTVYFIDVATGAFTDSMTVPSGAGDMSAYNEANTIFTTRGSALYRINTLAKTYDSIIIGNPFRVEERPNTKEAWVSGDSMIYIVNYATGLTSTTIDLSSNQFDNAEVRFTKGGSLAYKSAGSRKKIYKIDANTKAILDSIDTTPYSPFVIEVSDDSSKIYMSSNKAALIYDIATKTLVDSFVSNKQIMNLYRHPDRQELWAVHHFDDSVTVFNTTTKAQIASFRIGSSPNFLGFSKTGTTGVGHIAQNNAGVKMYPNPAHDIMYVNTRMAAKVIVYDMAGRVAGSYQHSGTIGTIPVTELAKGVYNVQVLQADGSKQTLQFVKK